MSGIMTTTVDHLIRSEIWSTRIKEIFEEDLFFMKYVNIIQDFPDGNVINIPSLGQMDVYGYEEGQAIKYTAIDTGNFQFNISTYLAQWAGRELGNDVGANAVSVALAAASAGATTAAGTAGGLGAQNTADRGYDYLITLFHSVLAPYRRRTTCSWVMSDPTAAVVRKVKTSDGLYIWEPATQAGQPDLILGKPVQIDTYVPDAAVSVESILFGDFSSVKVRIAGGVRFERSDEVGFNKDVATFRAVVRRGAVSVDANALKTLTHAGT